MADSGLEHLLSNYFHQDFIETYGGVWEAVAAFMARNPHLVRRVPDEVNEVLARYESEPALDAYLDALGCEYTASDQPDGYRGWLTEIARRVSAATGP